MDRRNTDNEIRCPGIAPLRCRRGFTLLEVLLVLFILGMIAALAVPAMGRLDDQERERMTRERMEAVRRAILGPDDRFDAQGRPLIGGYVGDLRAWPDLWEARAEIKPSAGGNWENPSSLPAGLGQGPDFILDPNRVFYRPSGRFVGKRWTWNRPYRRLYDDAAGNDHIGGLETENEGQPRGLWTRYPEELPFDIGSYEAPGLDLGEQWKGPYIAPPLQDNPADSVHWAVNDSEYRSLSPVPEAVWDPVGGEWLPTWEDGDYNPSGELGEHFDDKEAFRLLQSEGRLVDGWGRALRFFITADPDHAGSSIFWILSEGPDHTGTYPNKGTCGGHTWSLDTADVMSEAYDESDPKNLDNLVLKLYSRDWEAVFAEQQKDKEMRTRATLERLRKALVGNGPEGLNSGFTGDLARWPRLFRWEDNGTPADTGDDYWDNEDAGSDAYTKGQPRGLWTDSPNKADAGDDLAASLWGLGWRHAYLPPPVRPGEDNVLTDAWGREILFFHDTANGLWLILSRGADGLFDFYDSDTLPSGAPDGINDYREPASFTEAVDVTNYDPTAAVNADNCHIIVAASDWQPGFYRLLRFAVLNAVPAVTKARFFRTDGTPVSGVDLLTAATLTDEDGDLSADDWAAGDGTPADPAFNYDDTTTETIPCGARYLVFWNDTDGNDMIDSGEDYLPLIYDVRAAAGSGLHNTLTVDSGDFRPLP